MREKTSTRRLQRAAAKIPGGVVWRFLAKLPPGQIEIVSALRKVVRKSAPETAETVLWNSLSYHRPKLGGRIAGAVCLITPREDCVHVGFIHGASLDDPHRLLRGNGKEKRFVPVRDLRAADDETLRLLIRAAAEFDPRASNCSRPVATL